MSKRPLIRDLGCITNIEVINQFVSLDGQLVIDAGCGDLGFTRLLAEQGARVLAIDPDPVQAAFIAEQAGADGITVHLREDRRHITDRDVRILRQTLDTRMNLEMAVTEEMLAIACETKPHFCCLVPEKREELTTEEEYRLSNHISLQWNLFFSEFVQFQIGYTKAWAPSDQASLKNIFSRYGGRGESWWDEKGRALYPQAFVDHVEATRKQA